MQYYDEFIPPVNGSDWRSEDNDLAFLEGWGIFDVDSQGLYEIQRFDEAELFEDDESAVEHVVRLAMMAGSARHLRAAGVVMGPNGLPAAAARMRKLLRTSGLQKLYYELKGMAAAADPVSPMEEMVQ